MCCIVAHRKPMNSTITLRIDQCSEEELDRLASQTGVTRALLVRTAIRRFIESAKEAGSITLEPVHRTPQPEGKDSQQ